MCAVRLVPRGGITCGHAEKNVFRPVEDVHGAVHFRGRRAGEKELAGSHCSVRGDAVPEF